MWKVNRQVEKWTEIRTNDGREWSEKLTSKKHNTDDIIQSENAHVTVGGQSN